MGAIRVHEFISLDGVIDTPSWTFEYGFDPRMGEALAQITGDSGGILLGRKTYDMFAPVWPKRTAADDPGAPFFNDTTKYVVSATAPELPWHNSQRLGAYDARRIQRLKEETAGGLYVSGSGTLVRALLADGLVDELHLFMYPVTRSTGARLFPEGQPPSRWERTGGALYDTGVVYLQLTAAARSAS